MVRTKPSSFSPGTNQSCTSTEAASLRFRPHRCSRGTSARILTANTAFGTLLPRSDLTPRGCSNGRLLAPVVRQYSAGPESHPCNMLHGPPYAAHFTYVLSFGEGQPSNVGSPSPLSGARAAA